jgi:site-specific recombinase XerD
MTNFKGFIMTIEPFLNHLSVNRKLSPETIKAYRADLVRFATFLTERGLRINQVTPTTMAEYILHMQQAENPRFGRTGLSGVTINRRITAVRRYYEYLRATSNPKLKNPTVIIRHPRPRNDDPKAVDDQSLDTLLAGIDSIRDRTLFALFVATGLRLSEMWQLNRDSISIEIFTDELGRERRLGTGEVIGKRSKKRRFFFDGPTIDVVAAYLTTRIDANAALFLSERRKRMSRRAMQERLAYWTKKMGLPHAHPHQLRHSYATRLANANIDTNILKDLMGHDDLGTTNRYIHLHDQTLARGYFSAMEFLQR